MIEGFRLSPQQRRIWQLQREMGQTEPRGRFVIKVRGHLDVAALQRGWSLVANANEIFRTSFRLLPGMKIPLQVVESSQDFALPVIVSDADGVFAEYQRIAAETLDAASRNPLRAKLLRVSQEEHYIVGDLSALCGDGATLSNLAQGLAEAYEAAVQESEYRSETLQYADVAEWQNDLSENPEHAAGRSYWNGDLADLQPLCLLGERSSSSSGFVRRIMQARVGPALCSALAAQNLSPREGLLALWIAFLHLRTKEVVINTAVILDARNYVDLVAVMGPLAKCVPMSLSVREDETLGELGARLASKMQEIEARQEYYFRAPSENGGSRDFPYGFECREAVVRRGGEVEFSLSRGSVCFERHLLRFGCFLGVDGLEVELDFDAEAVDAQECAEVAEQFEAFACQVELNPRAPLRAFDALGAAELRRMTVCFNDTAAKLPDCCFHELFEAQAAAQPDLVALTFGDQRVTYRELNRACNGLAARLREEGVGPEVLVGILMERSIEMVVTLIAVLKAGGAYLPLDVGSPRQRLARVIQQSKAPLVATRAQYQEYLESSSTRAVLVELAGLAGADDNFPCPVAPENLAYVMFTSGSTGQPKGVMVSHKGLVNYARWAVEAYGLRNGITALVHSPLTFDLTITSLLCPLIAGGETRLLPEDDGVEHLIGGLKSCGESALLKVTPAHMEMINLTLTPPEMASKVDALVVGGEALHADRVRLWKKHAPRTKVFNEYGPTETVVGCCVFEARDDVGPSRDMPIGSPIANTRLYVLDRFRLAPQGAEGELHIGGAGLARGYLNDPALTADRFVPDWIGNAPGERLYKTGDLVRFNPQGQLVFVGRIDRQVKLRGYRIELGEIEAVLRENPCVEQSAVVYVENERTGGQLIGYAVPSETAAFTLLGWLKLQKSHGNRNLQAAELPNGLLVVEASKTETDYLFQEIFEEQVYLKHGIVLPEEGCVFDVGANVGFFSLFAGLSGRAIKVFSFEPIPTTCELLRMNLSLYPISAKVFNCGISNRSGSALFTHYPNLSLMSTQHVDSQGDREVVRLFETGKQRSDDFDPDLVDEMLADRMKTERHVCALKTISDVMREEGVNRIDLLKVDAERSELEVLQGIDEQDWSKIRQIVVEVHDEGGRLRNIVDLLSIRGYRVSVEKEAPLSQTNLYCVYCTRLDGAVSAQRLQRLEAAGRKGSPETVAKDLLEFLSQRLPPYMVPSRLCLLDELPLTANGKVDRRRLVSLEDGSLKRVRERRTPATAVESKLREIWSEALGIEQIGIDDNFFELGGHSLLVTRVMSRVRPEFGVDLPFRTFFDSPTISALGRRIEEAGKKGKSFRRPALARKARPNRIPLAFSQERLWFLERLSPGASAYIIPTVVRMTGGLAFEALAKALDEIVRRHEVLRTTFSMSAAGPEQAVHESWKNPVSLVDLQPLGAMASAEGIRLAREFVSRPFDLERDVLARFCVIRLEPEEYILACAFHHLVADGWSMSVLMKEVTALYSAFREGKPSPLPPLPIQFADFALWQREWLVGDALNEHIRYWAETLKGAPPILSLALDFPRPAVQTANGAVHSFVVSPELSSKVAALANEEGMTLFMVLLAGYSLLLSRYSGAEDLVVGASVANRTQSETEELIGFFVNTLPLRLRLAMIDTVPELFSEVRRVTLGAYTHQDLPFERMVSELAVQRELSHHPIVQVNFVLQNTPPIRGEISSLRLSPLGLIHPTAKYDLTLLMIESGGALSGVFEYNSDLFLPSTIDRMGRDFESLLSRITAVPTVAICELDFGCPARVNSDDGPPLLDLACAHHLFREQMKRSPRSVAIDCGSRHMTYQQLDDGATGWAASLLSRGVRTEDTIGVYMDRSLEAIVAILAILKAGAAYVPLDPNYPEARIRSMVEDASVRLILTESEDRLQRLSHQEIGCPALFFTTNPPPELKSTLEEPAVLPRNLAYVIFSSGSTGRPKGVAVEHQSLCRLAASQIEGFKITSQSRVLQFASLSFDASVSEIFTALLSGATLCVPERREVLIGPELGDFLVEQRISHVTLTPSNLAVLPDRSLDCLQTMVAAGEACSAQIVDRWSRNRLFINAYGPTENTVCATMAVRGAMEHKSSIGFPLRHVRVDILDRNLNHAPAGVIGEICLAGGGLARGYFNRPDLTAVSFVPDPFATSPGERLYRTGDLGMVLDSGEIVFIGRKDTQIKLRGIRIELGEIESVLATHPKIVESAISVEGQGEKTFLAAHVVWKDRNEADVAELLDFLQKRLPSHMIPTAVWHADRLPRSQNGKVDRKALQPKAGSADAATPAFVSPQNGLEAQIADIWKRVLTVERVGRNDNFFDLGGNSLLLARVHHELPAITSAPVTLVDLFRNPTVSTLAGFMSLTPPSNQAQEPTADETEGRRATMARQREKRQALRSENSTPLGK